MTHGTIKIRLKIIGILLDVLNSLEANQIKLNVPVLGTDQRRMEPTLTAIQIERAASK